MKKIIIAAIVIILIGLGIYFIGTRTPSEPLEPGATTTPATNTDPSDSADAGSDTQFDTMIGVSSEGRDIPIAHYGEGDTEVLFVGGIHGGYSWNTALLAYELMDFFEENPDEIPEGVKVSIVPVLNPDGLYDVVGTAGRFTRADVPSSESETIPGRFNANEVDLNRNFDCDWQAEGVWQQREVSGGTAAFSEAESLAMRTYIEATDPDVVVAWYSAAGGVFASNCGDGVLPETLELTNIYAEASGYPAYEEYDFYEITGDMMNWLARERVPAISVLLTNHSDIEWKKNRKGVEALLESLAD